MRPKEPTEEVAVIETEEEEHVQPFSFFIHQFCGFIHERVLESIWIVAGFQLVSTRTPPI